jgi:hypothetical protein
MFDGPSLASGEVVGNGDVRGVSYGNDAGLYVEFRKEPVHMEFLSTEAGRPIYEDRDFIKLYVPGDKTKVVDRPVKLEVWGDVPSDPQRFPRQWEAFKSGNAAAMTGTPLTEWPLITGAQRAMLAAANIHTLEQLAAVHDGALDGLGHGGRMLRDQAVARLASAQDDAFQTKMVAENSELKVKMAEMEARMKEQMNKLLETATAPPAKSTGKE